MLANAGNFPESETDSITKALENTPESKSAEILGLGFKQPVVVLLISLFVGVLGIDRFYLGQTKSGVFKLITCGGLGIWYIIDIFTAMKRARKVNVNNFFEAVNNVPK